MQQMSLSVAARANGECELRGTATCISFARPQIEDSVATVMVSISQNTSARKVCSRAVQVIVERRGARRVVTRERTLVET